MVWPTLGSRSAEEQNRTEDRRRVTKRSSPAVSTVSQSLTDVAHHVDVTLSVSSLGNSAVNVALPACLLLGAGLRLPACRDDAAPLLLLRDRQTDRQTDGQTPDLYIDTAPD